MDDQEVVVTRRVNPAVFVLALLLFVLLPSLTVSCDVPATGVTGAGRVDVDYTGGGILADHPVVHTAGSMARTPAWEDAYASRSDVMDLVVQALVVLTLVVMVLGVVTAFARTSRRRALAAAGVAGVAAILLTVTEVVATSRLETVIRNLASALSGDTSDADMLGRVDGIVATGPGFWLALAGLAVIVVVNAGKLFLARRR